MNEQIVYTATNDHSISVVMATYNGGAFLAEQIESILLQTRKPTEIIVCDDLSTDNTIQILQEYKTKGVLNYFINTHKLGVTGNFKKAVSLASGTYIALCDQDDIWLPEKLEKSFSALLHMEEENTPSMVYSDLILINSAGNLLNSSFRNELGHDKYQHCLETLLFGNFVLGCTVVMNKKMKTLFADIPDTKQFNHDAWITMIAFSFGRVCSLEQPYIKYRKHATNVTFNGHTKRTRFQRVVNHIKHSFTKGDYLHEQFDLVKSFFRKYKDQLPQKSAKVISAFLLLEHSSYIKKKLMFERYFRNKWINRF